MHRSHLSIMPTKAANYFLGKTHFQLLLAFLCQGKLCGPTGHPPVKEPLKYGTNVKKKQNKKNNKLDSLDSQG